VYTFLNKKGVDWKTNLFFLEGSFSQKRTHIYVKFHPNHLSCVKCMCCGLAAEKKRYLYVDLVLLREHCCNGWFYHVIHSVLGVCIIVLISILTIHNYVWTRFFFLWKEIELITKGGWNYLFRMCWCYFLGFPVTSSTVKLIAFTFWSVNYLLEYTLLCLRVRAKQQLLQVHMFTRRHLIMFLSHECN